MQLCAAAWSSSAAVSTNAALCTQEALRGFYEKSQLAFLHDNKHSVSTVSGETLPQSEPVHIPWESILGSKMPTLAAGEEGVHALDVAVGEGFQSVTGASIVTTPALTPPPTVAPDAVAAVVPSASPSLAP